MTQFIKFVAGSLAMAMLMWGANFSLGLFVSFFTGFGQRNIVSAGSLAIFILAFVLSLASHFEKKQPS